MGRIAGRIQIDGILAADSTFKPNIDPEVCSVPAPRGAARPKSTPGVVVWIDGLRSGKPLPLERRFTVTRDRCLFVPRTQAVIVGGTLNVLNLDPIAHTTRIVNTADNSVMAVIRQTGDGQVVPVDSVLRQPGRLELRCDLHPWARGWIVAFDQPYFAMASADGSFALDSVPPGRYRIVAWQEQLGEVADSVTVTDGQKTDVVLKGRVSK
jgi:hypothetical protein